MKNSLVLFLLAAAVASLATVPGCGSSSSPDKEGGDSSSSPPATTISITPVKSYTATGGSKMKMSGTVPDLEKPFNLTAAGVNGLAYKYSFRPGGPTFGGLSYTGSASGYTESGTGKYTVSLSEDGESGTITYNVSGKLVGPEISYRFSDSETFKLVRKDP